jgi:hypothetical protein
MAKENIPCGTGVDGPLLLYENLIGAALAPIG